MGWSLLAVLTGCSLFASAPEPTPEAAELRALQAEVRTLRAELKALRREVDVAHDVVVATAEPVPREVAQRADFARLEGAVDEVAELTGAVDLDLDLVERQVQGLQGRLTVAEAKVGRIEGVLDNHAELIDALNADLGALEDETSSLRPLHERLFVDGTRIVVDGLDLEFRPGVHPDGSPRPTGPVTAPLGSTDP